MRRLALLLTILFFPLVAPMASSATAVAGAKCPSGGTPAPGSTITGGLEVDGICVLTDVTVNGGITVDATPPAELCCTQNAAFLNGATVNGEIVVESGSGVIAGLDPDTFNLTHDRSTINGRMTFNTSGFFLVETTLMGGLTKNGAFDWPSICAGDPFCFGQDTVCDSEIFGNITMSNVNTEQAFLGDPNEQLFPNGDCAGNTIHGSIFLKDSNFIRFDGEPTEIEGNTVTGSVHIDHSTAEVNENTIGGSLLCTNGSVIHPGAGPHLQGNTVRGKNTCD